MIAEIVVIMLAVFFVTVHVEHIRREETDYQGRHRAPGRRLLWAHPIEYQATPWHWE